MEKQQQVLERELARVQNQLEISHKVRALAGGKYSVSSFCFCNLQALDENGSDMSRFEQDMNALTLELHNSVQRDISRGHHSSTSTLTIENNMRKVQQRSADLHKVRVDMMHYIQNLRQQENYLIDEIRKAPTGVSGAEPLPQKKKQQNTWYETDIDNNFTKDRGPETEEQIKKENKNIFKSGGTATTYINTYEEERHNYENFDTYENFKNNLAKNPYEDDVQTIHSEGVRSEMEGPPLPDRPHQFNSEEIILGMGDISEADERVQRFYGILPKEKPLEIKTVRMVKRDNKERSSKTKRGNSEDDSESVELSVDEEEQPPPPLPRGNYQNLHNFLSNKPYEGFTTNYTSQNGTDNQRSVNNNNSNNNNNNNNNNGSNNIHNGHSVQSVQSQPKQRNVEQRPVFKLGELSQRSAESLSRPGSSMSAHERLFGNSRDSLSPEVSPVKTSSIISSDSSQSAILSPVFKSAAAKAIIEEERKTPMIIPKAKKKKKRHMTITSSHPAVLEALNRHDAKVEEGRVRSRDDLDIERTLKQPSDAPDLVQSTYSQQDPEFRSNAFDNLFGVPEKIIIPERYVPDQVRLGI